MTASPIRYPELPAEISSRAPWRSLRWFGAGAIIASVTIGSGETLFASRGGAVFGYSLLWCFLGGALLKGIQVYSAARYMTLTGTHPMAHWAYLPGPKNWVPLTIGILSLASFPFWLGGLPRMLGEIINWIVGIEADDPKFALLAKLWGTLAVLVAVTLTLLQSYDVLEKVQTTLVGLLLASLGVACFAARPDWMAAVWGTFIPTFPVYEAWVAEKYPTIFARPPWVEVVTYLGAIGGGTYDYIGYIGCLREKGWGAIGRVTDHDPDSGRLAEVSIDLSPENTKLARKWLWAPMVDTGVSFLSVLLFTAFFVILGAAILHPAQTVPAGRELLSHQAGFLTLLHPWLLYLYEIGIFIAFWGTLYGAYEIDSRTTYECLDALGGRFRGLPYKKVRLGVLIYAAFFGLLLMWTVEDPVALVTPAAIVGGVFACGLWCFAMIWTDRRFLPGPLRMGWWLVGLTAFAGSVLTGLGARGIWDYFMGAA